MLLLLEPFLAYRDYSGATTLWGHFSVYYHEVLEATVLWAPYIFGNCGIAVALNLVQFCSLKLMTATSFMLAQYVKDLGIVLGGIVFFGESVGPLQAFGCGVTLVACSLYAKAKQNQEEKG